MIRNILALTALVTCFLAAAPGAAAPGDAVWARFINNEALATADGQGGTVVAAGFYQPVDFGSGTITPVSFGDLAVIRYDGAGQVNWLRHIVPGNDGSVTVKAVTSDSTGAVYLGGTLWSGSVDFGGGALSGMSETFLVKLDAAGDHLWSRLVGNLELRKLAASSGRLAVLGNNTGTTDLGGGPLTALASANICAGVLDTDGNHIWSGQWGNNLQQWALGGGVDAAGNLTLAATVTGTVDFGGGGLTAANVDLALASFDPAGNHRWSKLLTGTFGYFNIQADCDVSPDGRSAVTGWYTGEADLGGGTMTSNGEDGFVAVHDTHGEFVWARSFGAGDDDAGKSVSIAATGQVAVAGSFVGTVDFGGGGITGPGSDDLFLAVYDGTGSHLGSWAHGTPDPDDSIHIDQTPEGDLAIWGFGTAGLDFGLGPAPGWGPYVAVIEGAGGGEPAPTGMAPRLVTAVTGHPNPFNPSTTISYTVARPGRVSVAAYDPRGRRVQELVQDRWHEAGPHTVRFRPEASGIYLVQVRAGAEVQTVKMMAVK